MRKNVILIMFASIPGPVGSPGSTGPAGVPGEAGPRGPVGNMGPTGPQGLKGDVGSPGAIGQIGAPGTPGEDGATGPYTYITDRNVTIVIIISSSIYNKMMPLGFNHFQVLASFCIR